MKNYLFTESQIKKVVDFVINEQHREREVLKIQDLAELVSRTGYDYDTLLSVFQDMFQSKGDEGVMDLFKAATGLELENLAKGRYLVKY